MLLDATHELPHGVTVVIPAHNSSRFIGEALDSVLSQRVDHLQVLVVENGSTDDTAQIANRFASGVQVIRAAVVGAQAARNIGLKLAAFKYLKMLDADDRLLADVLETQLQHAERLEKDRPWSFPYGDVQFISADGRVINTRHFKPIRNGENPLGHALEHAPLTSSPLHRTALVRGIGGFDESLPREHETDLFFRLLLASATPQHFPLVTYQYRQHEDGSNLMAGGVSRHGEMWPCEYLDKRLSDVRALYGNNIPYDVSLAFGRKYWREGRAVLREGYVSAAQTYFNKARVLAGSRCVNGSRSYRILNAMFGPAMAEEVGNWVHGSGSRSR